MSEYTPDTNEVQIKYKLASRVGDEQGFAEFNRWLAQHDAELLRKHADFIRERDDAGEWVYASSAAVYLYEEANATTEKEQVK